MAKEAKSTAFEPLIIEVEAAFLQGTAGGALWYINGRSLFVFLLSEIRKSVVWMNMCTLNFLNHWF